MREIKILNNKKLQKAPKPIKKIVLLLEVEEKEPLESFLSVENKLKKEIKALKKQISGKKSINQEFRQKLLSFLNVVNQDI